MKDILQFYEAGSTESEPASADRKGLQHAAIAERVSRQQTALLEIMKSGLLTQDLQTVYTRLTEITACALAVPEGIEDVRTEGQAACVGLRRGPRLPVWATNACGSCIGMAWDDCSLTCTDGGTLSGGQEGFLGGSRDQVPRTRPSIG